MVVADETTANILNLDFISFGTQSNSKTSDVLANSTNKLAEYNELLNTFVSKDGKPLWKAQPKLDYGIILKIHPDQFPQRTWIACAGVDEYGTSGTSWFLANKWPEIANRVEENDQFMCVIAVEPGKDESARLHHFVKDFGRPVSVEPTPIASLERG